MHVTKLLLTNLKLMCNIRHERGLPEIPPKPSKSHKMTKHHTLERSVPQNIMAPPPPQAPTSHLAHNNVVFGPVFSENAVMDDLLMMGGGDTCDRYDQHGVKIDYQYNSNSNDEDEMLKQTYR